MLGELEAELAELREAYNEMISQSQDQILELQAELAALREAAKARISTGHDPMCLKRKIGDCGCGHDKLKALLQERGE